MSDGRRDSIDVGAVKGCPTPEYTETTKLCKFPHVIAELIAAGVEVLVRKNSFVLAGFYKSGEVQLMSGPDGKLIAIDRYSATVQINELRDIVELNFDWWDRSRNRGVDGWKNPCDMWLPLLKRFNFVTQRQETVTEPVL